MLHFISWNGAADYCIGRRSPAIVQSSSSSRKLEVRNVSGENEKTAEKCIQSVNPDLIIEIIDPFVDYLHEFIEEMFLPQQEGHTLSKPRQMAHFLQSANRRVTNQKPEPSIAPSLASIYVAAAVTASAHSSYQ